MSKTGTIYGINGPVIYLAGNTGFKMSEMVYVGKEKLVGEVIDVVDEGNRLVNRARSWKQAGRQYPSH